MGRLRGTDGQRAYFVKAGDLKDQPRTGFISPSPPSSLPEFLGLSRGGGTEQRWGDKQEFAPHKGEVDEVGSKRRENMLP